MPELPEPIEGHPWRPVTVDDAEALARLHAACHAVDGGYLMVPSEYRDDLNHPANDAAADTIGVFDESGEAIAFGYAFMTGGEVSTHRVYPWAEVHPEYRRRGIGTALQTWLERRAMERLESCDDGLPSTIRLGAYSDQADRIELFERLGFEPVRYWSEMLRDLSLPFPSLPPMRGIAILGWSEVNKEAAREVHNQAFADHWGSEPVSPEGWEHRFNEFFLPEASYVAYDGETPVAYLTSAMYPHDFESRGRTEAWIEGLGTIRSCRGRGIATTMLLEAFARYRDRDLQYAVIGVDAENPTGAVGLYERMGFVTEKQSVTYAKSFD